MDPIRDVTTSARQHAADFDFAPLKAKLDTTEAAINGLDEIVVAHQADFDAIRSTYDAVPAANRAGIFGDLNAKFAKLGKRIAQRKAGPAEVSDVRRAVERAIIPDNKESRNSARRTRRPPWTAWLCWCKRD